MNKLAILALLMTGGLLFAQVTTITSVLCSIVSDIQAIVGILALAMFIIGGVMYAVAHFLPAGGNYRSNVQGWGVMLMMGGIIGLIFVIIAPYIVGLVTGIGGASFTSSCPT